jgi:flavodoxin
LIIYNSIYYGNTEKIAKAIAKCFEASLVTPQKVDIKIFLQYGLVGFGSGIYYNKHHQSLFDIVEKIPSVNNIKAFIFSTNRDGMTDGHKLLRDTLREKGFSIIGEFACKGFEDWRAMKVVGGKGINEGKPDEQDLKNAEKFGLDLKREFNIGEKRLTIIPYFNQK